MAINKKLIHFNTFENFNSLKLSANVENTKYTLGINGEIQTGSPDILYLSIVYIKDTKQQWTHGLLYTSDDNYFETKVESQNKLQEAKNYIDTKISEINTTVEKLSSSTLLEFYCIKPVDIMLNDLLISYPANFLVSLSLNINDEFEILPSENDAIISLTSYPGAINTFYPWLEGVKLFNNILFNMNNEDLYTKWSQGQQGQYNVQYAQYTNCIFWSDLAYISDVNKRTNYTLYSTSELPLCYSSIPENTFKSFYCAYGVTTDPNWSNPLYKNSFALATHATQVFSYYGLHSIGVFDMDASYFNIKLPKDCRGLMYSAGNILNAGVFDAINVTNFGAKSGSWRDAFSGCYMLKNLRIKNLKVNINISWSPINQESIEYILNKAANTNNITISLSPYTYYALTDENKALAAERNITLELISTNLEEDNRLKILKSDGDGTKYLSNDGTYKTIDDNTYPTLKTINGESLLGEGNISTYQEITYQDLIELRNKNLLKPSQQYRIINYTGCLGDSINYSGNNHQFDIVVTAISNNKLSEIAQAVHNNIDTYFDNNNVTSWEIKYCLDNDSKRFGWIIEDQPGGVFINNKNYVYSINHNVVYEGITYRAFIHNNDIIYVKGIGSLNTDTQLYEYYEDFFYGWVMEPITAVIQKISDTIYSSHGVIYYLKDEFGNEAPYDFKTILINEKYTFGNTEDDSLTGNSRFNTIKERFDGGGSMILPSIILGNSCFNNIFDVGCHDITLGNSCDNNSFGTECYNISLGFMSNKNVFGKNCSDMTFGTSLSNKFGNLCRENKLGNNCNYNTFLDACVNNTLLDNVKFCTLEKYCYNNIIPKSCSNKRINSGTHDLSEGFWDSELNEIYNYLNEYHTIKATNCHEYVDLGLPSGLLWATCNVGAETPEEYGDYFAWGETSTKETYTEENCETCGKELNDISGDVQYDAAAANWGDGWRIPTNDEIQELIDNCTWTWTTYNGVNGYSVEGLNGNSIFLPAAGYYFGSSLYDAGTRGTYQSSIYSGNNFNSCYFSFNSNNQSISSFYRRYGRSVRPVRPVLSEIPAEPQLTYTQYIPNEASMPTNPIEGVLYLIGDE